MHTIIMDKVSQRAPVNYVLGGRVQYWSINSDSDLLILTFLWQLIEGDCLSSFMWWRAPSLLYYICDQKGYLPLLPFLSILHRITLWVFICTIFRVEFPLSVILTHQCNICCLVTDVTDLFIVAEHISIIFLTEGISVPKVVWYVLLKYKATGITCT